MLCLLAGCGGAPTELVIVVNSDLRTPDELSLVRAVVSDDRGTPVSLNDFRFNDPSMALVLPFSFVVVPSGENHARAVTIELVAQSPDRTALFTRRAETQFIADRRLRLPMFLARQCATLASSCGDGMTCAEEGCVAALNSAASLAEIEPGEELTR